MGGKKKTPPPPTPKAPPPPVEDISAEVISPTLRQEAARRARRGAYVTKGQKMGAGGQVLGASPIQLADVEAASGIYESTPEEEKLERPRVGIFTRRQFKGSQLQELKKMGYKPTSLGELPYRNYIRQYEQRKAQRRKRAEAAKSRGGMTI
mgnify:CR=1 FL=1